LLGFIRDKLIRSTISDKTVSLQWTPRAGPRNTCKTDSFCRPQSEKAHEVPTSISTAFDPVQVAAVPGYQKRRDAAPERGPQPFQAGVRAPL